MSGRSEVVIALKKSINDLIVEANPMLKYADNIYTHELGTLYHFDNIKWNDIDPVVGTLYALLEQQSPVDYLIIQACFDYPESSDGDKGKWVDNPWNLYRRISVSVNIGPMGNVYVKYTVMNKVCFAGPYDSTDLDNVQYHKRDIENFDGVYNVSIVSESEKLEFEKTLLFFGTKTL